MQSLSFVYVFVFCYKNWGLLNLALNHGYLSFVPIQFVGSLMLNVLSNLNQVG